MNAAPGDTLSIPISVDLTPSIPVTLVGSTVENLSIALDTNLLTPLGFYPKQSGVTATGPTLTANRLTYLFTAPSGLTLQGKDTLGVFKFKISISDSGATNLQFTASAMSSQDPRCIVTTVTNTQVNVSLAQECGNKTLQDFMNTGVLTLGIARLVPNPASGMLHVSLLKSPNAIANYRVIDALGNMRLAGTTQNDVDLDVSALASGVYAFEVSLPSGERASRMLLVQH
jgi:hypothetical protein